MSRIVLHRSGGRAAVLCLTPALRELRRTSTLEIAVETSHPRLLDKNPDVAEAELVLPWCAATTWLDLAAENRPDLPYIDAFAEALGITLTDRMMTYSGSTSADADRLAKLTAPISDLPIVAVHTGRARPGYSWPFERWNTVTEWIRAHGHRVLLIGRSKVCNPPHDLDLRGELSIGEAAFALMMSCLFIGIDAFPLYLAQSQGCPVIPLLGATRASHVLGECVAYPVEGSAPCAGIAHRYVGQHLATPCSGDCMRAISPEMVIEAIQAAWAKVPFGMLR